MTVIAPDGTSLPEEALAFRGATEVDEREPLALYEEDFLALDDSMAELLLAAPSCSLVFFASNALVVLCGPTIEATALEAITALGRELSSLKSKGERWERFQREGCLSARAGGQVLGVRKILFSACLVIVAPDAEALAAAHRELIGRLRWVRDAYAEYLAKMDRFTDASLCESGCLSDEEIDALFND